MPDYAAIVETFLSRYDIQVVRWRKSMSGCAWATFKTDGTSENFIEAPQPKTPISLAIFLHEVGHHAIGFFTYKKRCEEEYHAWMFALDTMREFGVEPDARTQRRFDRSMRYAVDKAVRRGVRALPEPLHAFLPAA